MFNSIIRGLALRRLTNCSLLAVPVEVFGGQNCGGFSATSVFTSRRQVAGGLPLERKEGGHAVPSGTVSVTKTPCYEAVIAGEDENSASLPFQPCECDDSDEAEVPLESKERFILLAYRALLWGTLYSIAGVSILTVVGMYVLGFSSVADVLENVRVKSARDFVLLLEKSKAHSGNEVVRHYDLDLTDPTKAWDQMLEIWKVVSEESQEDKE